MKNSLLRSTEFILFGGYPYVVHNSHSWAPNPTKSVNFLNSMHIITYPYVAPRHYLTLPLEPYPYFALKHRWTLKTTKSVTFLSSILLPHLLNLTLIEQSWAPKQPKAFLSLTTSYHYLTLINLILM